MSDLLSWEKHKLARTGEFINMVKMLILHVAADVTHEKPNELTFGSAQTAVDAAGITSAAQATMHQQRRQFAQRIINSRDAMAEQASHVIAASIVAEMAELESEAAVPAGTADDVAALCRAFYANPAGFMASENYATLESVVSGLIENGFSAMSGYNVHVDPFNEEPPA